MKSLFNRVKKKLSKEDFDEEAGESYVEITGESEERKSKIQVRPFALTDFADVKPILEALREGYSIALVNIAPLKDKDIVELKRAINKLKKTTDAIDGDIAGFGDDWIAITPSFATIHREKPKTPKVSLDTEVDYDEF